ncbi:MAG: hypothetical protein AAFN50_10765 [Pseudomonadota bacterium]
MRAMLVAALLVILLASVGHAGPAQPQLDSLSLPEALKAINESGVHRLPELSADELQALKLGKTVTLIQRSTREEIEAFGVYGMQVVNAPRVLVWTALLGGNRELDPRYSRSTLLRDERGGYTRYQHVNLPWPVRDRHWVIYSRKNTEVAEHTDGSVWQHHWSLIDGVDETIQSSIGKYPEITNRRYKSAVILNSNAGAWSTVALDADRTLVTAWFDFDLGGLFPAGIVRSVSRKSLRKALLEIESRSLIVHETYEDGPTIHDGFGIAISQQQLVHALRKKRDESRSMGQHLEGVTSSLIMPALWKPMQKSIGFMLTSNCDHPVMRL